MKKIMAILLAVLMLLGASAFAEGTAAVMTVDNINLSVPGQSIALDDLAASVALDSIGGAASIVGLVEGGGEKLVTAVAQIADGNFAFTVDGLDHAYGAALPAQVAEQAGQLGALLPQILPSLDNLSLPAIPGITIPKLDLTGTLSSFSTGNGTFAIPHEMIDALLDQLLQLAQSGSLNVPNIDQAVALLQQVKASGMSLAIQGTIVDDAAAQVVSADIYLVSGDNMSDAPLANLSLDTRENSLLFTLSVDTGAGMSAVANATLSSNPDTAELNFDLNLAGIVTLGLGVFPEEGLQKIALDLSASGQQANLEFGYGQQNGKDVVALSGAAAGASFAFSIDTAMGADGVRTGTLSLTASQRDQTIAFSGDITMQSGADLGLEGFTMPGDVRAFDQLDQSELMPFLQPAIDYISSHASMSEAA